MESFFQYSFSRVLGRDEWVYQLFIEKEEYWKQSVLSTDVFGFHIRSFLITLMLIEFFSCV